MTDTQPKRTVHISQQLKNLQRRINSPKTDLLESSEHYIVRMELPVKSFSWEVREGQLLFVSFEKEQERFGEVKEIYREAKYGRTMRRVKLPGRVLEKLAKESFENGVWIAYFAKETVGDLPNSGDFVIDSSAEGRLVESWADA
jgi:HSP20 family molecular chaperone IbpA